MKLLLAVIALLLTVLVKIGDFVIATAGFLLTSLEFTLSVLIALLSTIFSNIVSAITTLAFLTWKTLGYIPSKLTSRILIFGEILFYKLSQPIYLNPQKESASQQKPIVKRFHRIKKRPVFPIPFRFKLKYFIEGTLFSTIFVFLPFLFFIFIQDLPSPNSIWLGQIPQTTKIYDRNETLLYQIYANQNRTVVPLESIPKYLQEATIATEDKDFYSHPGFDISAIIRSVIANFEGKNIQGGSTITQQLVKSALLSPETSVIRKLKEVILAFWMERMYSKQQILEAYFNEIAYGGTAWGAQAAAETYFGKDVKDLDLAQAAFLAGVPQAPTLYSPYGSTPHAWKKRQQDVLSRMVALGYITKDQANDAASEELTFQPLQDPIKAPHFANYIKDLLIQKYGIAMVERGGLIVITSLDLKIQAMAEKVVKQEIENDEYLNVTNGAALITNPSNGDILAMAGSREYNYPGFGKVNVTTSPRQPGSSIKVVTYSAALEKGFTAATILDDSPITFYSEGGPSYSPVNYDGRFHGRLPLRLALANSLNIPAVKVLNQVQVQTMVNLAKRMGITTWDNPEQYGLSITLGSAEVTMLDMANVYGTLANFGTRIDIDPLLKVTDYKGNALKEKGDIVGNRVLDPGIAFILSNILADNNARSMEFGPNSPLNIPGHTISVKTGTSDNKRDNWTFGYTKNYLVAVWVGNDDNTPMSQSLASGITGAAPIWHTLMASLLGTTPDQKSTPPPDIVAKPCLGHIEYFLKGTENSVGCGPLPTPTNKPDQSTTALNH